MGFIKDDFVKKIHKKDYKDFTKEYDVKSFIKGLDDRMLVKHSVPNDVLCGVHRVCEDAGKVEEGTVKVNSYRKAIMELVKQFNEDMDKYGQYLTGDEQRILEHDFLTSLGKTPGYEISGSYVDKNGVKRSFSVSAELVLVREKMKSYDKNIGDDGRGGGPAGQKMAKEKDIWKKFRQNRFPEKKKEVKPSFEITL